MKLSLAGIWTPKLYDRIAKNYDRFTWLVSPGGEQAYHRVVAHLRDGSLLDVGCGTGTLLAMAQANGLRCYGLDSSPGMLAQARAKVPHASLVEGSFYAIPYADGSFDYVVETNALSGVGIDAERALCEMLRVCKVGGQVRFADYAKPPKVTWVQRLTVRIGLLIGDYPVDYRALLARLGYEPQVEIIGGQDMYQFFCVERTR